MFGLVAGQRFSSPTIDAAGAATGMGAYGPDDGGRNDSGAPRIALRSPDLYTDWERDEFGTIRWQTYGDTGGAAIRLDLYQDGPEGPAFFATITPATADDGEFVWAPEQSNIPFGAHWLRIQASVVGFVAALDRSTEAFTVPADGNNYFVDDASDLGDEYTPGAVGDVRHTGKTPAEPKPSVHQIFRTYDIIGGTVAVDTGDYELPDSLRLSGSVDLGFGLDEGFLLTGPTDPAREAVLSPTTTTDRPWPLVELVDADFVSVAHFSLNDAQRGLYTHDGSDNVTVSHVTASGHALEGLRVETNAAAATYSDITVTDNGGTGLWIVGSVGELVRITAEDNAGDGVRVDGRVGLVHESVAQHNASMGFALFDAGPVRVERVQASHNGIGIRLFTSAPSATIGNTDLAAGLGNVVSANRDTGIQTTGNVLVAGNVVTSTQNGYGLLINGGRAEHNLVTGNHDGINAFSAMVVGNRVVDNGGIGIFAQGDSPISENVIEGSLQGIWAQQFFTGRFGAPITNNLLVNNGRQGNDLGAGILVQGGGALEIANNTVVQEWGTAIRLEGGTIQGRLRNNILSVDDGYGVYVAPDSQAGFASDYNLFQTGVAGLVGFWQGDRETLAAWQNAAFVDQNSLTGDPLFVDPANHDFHLESLYGSFHGGSFAPALDAQTQLPILPTATLSLDAAQSPAIDRGDPTSSFAGEPTPNGGFINLGAYGGTAQASLSPAQYVLVTRPSGGESWPVEQTFDIRWRSHNTAGTVDVELWRTGGVAPVLIVADDTANDGELSWTIPADTLVPASDYLIRVVRADGVADINRCAVHNYRASVGLLRQRCHGEPDGRLDHRAR